MASRDPAELFGYDVKGNDRPAPRLSPHQFGHFTMPATSSLANVPGQVSAMRDQAVEGQRRIAKAGRDFQDLRSGRKSPMQVINEAAGIASPAAGELRRQTDQLSRVSQGIETMAGQQRDMNDRIGGVMEAMARPTAPAAPQPQSRSKPGPLAEQLGRLSEDEAQAIINSVPRAQSRPKVAGSVVSSGPTPSAPSTASGSMPATVGMGRAGAGRPTPTLQGRQFGRQFTIEGPAVDVAVEGHPNALASGVGWPLGEDDGESFSDYPPPGSRPSGLGWPQ